MPNGGVCSRCLDLPYCRSCKRHLASICFDNPNVCQVRFMPSSRLLTFLAQLTKQLSDTDYCLFVSGVHPQTKKTSLHARHRQHRQRSSVSYKSRRHILPSLSASQRRSNRQSRLRARGTLWVHLLFCPLFVLPISSFTFI